MRSTRPRRRTGGGRAAAHPLATLPATFNGACLQYVPCIAFLWWFNPIVAAVCALVSHVIGVAGIASPGARGRLLRAYALLACAIVTEVAARLTIWQEYCIAVAHSIAGGRLDASRVRRCRDTGTADRLSSVGTHR